MNRTANSYIEQLAADHGGDLLRYLSRRVRTAADARDLTQEVYVRLLRLERKDLIQNPQAYLYRVAANLLHEFELRRRSDLDGLRRWAAEPAERADGVGLDRLADNVAIGRELHKVLAELSPKCRAVVILHRRDGMTYDEIAAVLGISSSMVKKYLLAGLKHCRARLRVRE
ncbi:MAG: sigma-70 family RNA polymerase sigma factor [Devosia sp.]